jgi:murein L,D-transpeptidase YcbB/YkuD
MRIHKYLFSAFTKRIGLFSALLCFVLTLFNLFPMLSLAGKSIENYSFPINGYRYIPCINSEAQQVITSYNTYDSVEKCDTPKESRLFSLIDGLGLDKTIFYNADGLPLKNLSQLLLYNAAYGVIPDFSYNGIVSSVDSVYITSMYSKLLEGDGLQQILDSVEPKFQSYKLLKKYLQKYSDLALVDTVCIFNDTIISRLKTYSILLDSDFKRNVSDEVLKNAINRFQILVDIDTTGIVDKKTIAELLVPLSFRVREIKESLNYFRWLNRLKDACILLVNIPAANLHIIKEYKIVAEMKVILGKFNTQTPIFTSYIYSITTYPYWVVPRNIAIKELLPKIKSNGQYLDDNNLQVIDKAGKEVNAQDVKWSALSAEYFPYILRQSTGCDNSLGLLKFDMESPFNIYLHDTNVKRLFNLNKRFLSHGCIRVEQAILLAQILSGDKIPSDGMDKLNSCLKNQKPDTIKLYRKCPVVIAYMPASVDENGSLKFYIDVYGRMHK